MGKRQNSSPNVLFHCDELCRQLFRDDGQKDGRDMDIYSFIHFRLYVYGHLKVVG